MQKRIVKKIKGYPLISKCEMCGAIPGKFAYEYKPTQYVSDHIPESLHVCKKCVYREVFGSKNFRKKIKEGVLDGETEKT